MIKISIFVIFLLGSFSNMYAGVWSHTSEILGKEQDFIKKLNTNNQEITKLLNSLNVKTKLWSIHGNTLTQTKREDISNKLIKTRLHNIALQKLINLEIEKSKNLDRKLIEMRIVK